MSVNIFEAVRLALQERGPLVQSVLLGALIILISTTSYRLCFHPLAGIPGPRLAAVTNLWAYYHELRGALPEKVRALQKKYGWPDVIRVGPNRVVVHDPRQYDVIYHVGSKFLKDPSFYESFPNTYSGQTTTTTVNKNFHASRRKDTMTLLSRQNVGGLRPLVEEKLHKTLARMEAASKAGEAVNMFAAWRCMTMDIISDFAFGTCLNSLDEPGFESNIVKVLEATITDFYRFLRIPGVFTLSRIPMIDRLSPVGKNITEFQKWTFDCVRGYKADPNTHHMFDTLMSQNASTALSIEEVQGEAQELLVAGSDTTATTLLYACVHLARQPELWERLYQEVQPVFEDPYTAPPVKVLEQLPFLTACLKESLRLAAPVPCYLWRIVPQDGYTLDVNGKPTTLPPGTSIGMSAAIQHYDEELFPEPFAFKPSRWLVPEGASKELDRYLVPFSKGTRQCGGINLAWMELYLALSSIVMRLSVKAEVEPGKELVQLEYFVGALTVRHTPNKSVKAKSNLLGHRAESSRSSTNLDKETRRLNIVDHDWWKVVENQEFT